MPQLTLQTDEKFDSTLADLVKSNPNADSKADIVQRAVATYKFLQDAIKDNKQIQLVDSSNPASVVNSNIQLP